MSELYVPGWHNDPAEVQASLTRLPGLQGAPAVFGAYGDAAGSDKTVLLWEAETKVRGRVMPSWNQKSVGSCVSFGNGRAANDLLMQMVATGASSEPPGDVATEPIYGGSRVEVGRGIIPGDGSVGAWAAEWLIKWGVLFRTQYGSIDLREYSESRCRQYGSRGCPDELEPIAREHPVRSVALVQSAAEAWAALDSYYPVSACSNRGFTTTLREGFCEASGVWNHCMELRGKLVSRSRGKCFVIQNSWANYLSGEPVVEDKDGKRIELPEGCFCAEYDVVDYMMRQGDSFALSNAVGFPVRQKLDWVF